MIAEIYLRKGVLVAFLTMTGLNITASAIRLQHENTAIASNGAMVLGNRSDAKKLGDAAVNESSNHTGEHNNSDTTDRKRVLCGALQALHDLEDPEDEDPWSVSIRCQAYRSSGITYFAIRALVEFHTNKKMKKVKSYYCNKPKKAFGLKDDGHFVVQMGVGTSGSHAGYDGNPIEGQQTILMGKINDKGEIDDITLNWWGHAGGAKELIQQAAEKQWTEVSETLMKSLC